MALLKHNGNLISTGAGLLGYTSTVPSLINGGWKHKDTGAWTEFAEWFPDYGLIEGPPEVVSFNGFSIESIGQYAELVSEIKFREGCTLVENISKSPDPDRQVTLYEHLQVMDFPSTIESLGGGNSIFDGLDQLTTIIVRAVTPPAVIFGNVQSPQAMMYVPDSAVDTYKSDPTWGVYSSIIFPLSDIE